MILQLPIGSPFFSRSDWIASRHPLRCGGSLTISVAGAFPVQLPREPADEEQRGRTKSGACSISTDLIRRDDDGSRDDRKIARARGADARGASQLRSQRTMRCRASCCAVSTRLHLRVKIAPGLAVVNHAIDPGPKLRVHRSAKFLLPPEIERQIGIELRENNVREEAAIACLGAKRRVAPSKSVCCPRG